MKRKDIKALHTKTPTELIKELAGKRKELSKLITEKKLTQVKNSRLLRGLRDDLARIQTVLASKQFKETS